MGAPSPSQNGAVGVTIGLDAMYLQIQGMAGGLTRVESKLDNLTERLADDIQQARDDVSDHEERIRTLERSRWPLPTLAALTGVAGAATGIVAMIR